MDFRVILKSSCGRKVFDIIGIVGCKSLYEEIKRFGKGHEIRLVQQGLHDLPSSEEMRDVIQEEVTEVDSPNLEYIALIYGNCGGGVEGVKSEYTKIVIFNSADCIDPLKAENMDNKGNSKSSGVFYLTRGWMDCGNDPLKEFKVTLNEEGDLVEFFLKAAENYPDMEVDWYKSDKYQRIKNQGRKYDKERLERVFYEIMKEYDKVEIINNDNLYEVHYKYAEIFREFLQNLHYKHGDRRHVELREVEGNLGLLKKILCVEIDLEDPSEGISVFEPEEPVELGLGCELEQS